MSKVFAVLVARYLAELEAERLAEAQGIEEAAAHRGVLPPNYWQARFRAEQRLKALREIEAAFQEELTP